MLQKVLALIDVPAPDRGLAALRHWGQTGERPDSWLAGADPLHLETRLHTLRVRSFRPDELPDSDVKPLFDHLQAVLGASSKLTFTNAGNYGYLQGDESIATAPISAAVAHGLPPDEFAPAGGDTAAHHRLLGEVQMVLHDHGVNHRRRAEGQAEINSLWFWGGGWAPEAVVRPLPKLFADDPLFRGFWMSCRGDVTGWIDGVEELCTKVSPGFVAVMPEHEPHLADAALNDCLDQLRELLRSRAVRSLTLLFRDGLSIEINRWHLLRTWRAVSLLLEKTVDDE